MPVRTLILWFLALMLVGCGTATSATSGPGAAAEPAATPADVHQHFIEALRINDRQAALDLTGDISLKAGMVDTWLGAGAALQRESHFIGKFTRVEVLAPAAAGQGQTAISVWQYERGESCYQAKLAQTDAGWKVIDWFALGLGGCPTA